MLPPDVRIRHELRPGDIGLIIHLHGLLYGKEYGWDQTFETYVAVPLCEFVRSRTDREQIWIVEKGETVRGSMAIVQAEKDVAQLRWLLLHPDLRGVGIGRILVEEAIVFCRGKGYHAMFLWTESRLKTAAQLYKSVGFALTKEKTHELWGTIVTEQRYDLALG